MTRSPQLQQAEPATAPGRRGTEYATSRPRVLEVTSFGEVALAQSRNEESHPAFANLFVETEILSDRSAILCTRRRRASDETPPWMFHAMLVHGQAKPAPVLRS